MNRGCVWLVLSLAVLSVSCDDKDGISPEILGSQQEQDRRARAGRVELPTTRELAETPMRRLKLGSFPVSLKVPQTWHLKSEADGALITLTGLATSGEINIQLLQPATTPFSAAQVESMVASIRKEADSKPHEVNRVQLRDLGPLKVLEQRMMSNAFINGKLPPEKVGTATVTGINNKVEVTTRAVLEPHLLKWSLTIFVPSGEKYTVRGLSFQALRLSEYLQDRQLLEKIIGSMKYEE